MATMRSGATELLLYLAAAAAYITLGAFFYRFLLSWVEGAGFLLLTVWLIPLAVRALVQRR